MDIKEFKLTYKFQKKDLRDYFYQYKNNEVLNESESESVKTPFINSSLITSVKNIKHASPIILASIKNSVNQVKKVTLPASFSLRNSMSPILNQGPLGSCVSNAFSLYVSTITKSKMNMSRLYHYAVTRSIEQTALSNDSGLYIRDGAKTLGSYGLCNESLWPYIISRYNLLPPLNVFKNSVVPSKYIYTFINQDLLSLKSCLVTNNVPIVFGFLVYNSFLSSAVAMTGIVPMPNLNTEILQGGHCTLIVGYDDSKQWFICANSWGTGWGDKGYFYMPYNYITNLNLTSDFCFLTLSL
jgi:C1A family cysteine protease